MNTRLLTPDGFPRADLDVAQSRCPSSYNCNKANIHSSNNKISYHLSEK